MEFHGFQGSGVGDACHRDPGPKETFTRYQLAAISSIFTGFMDFHEISWISMEFRGRGLGTSAIEIAPEETFSPSQLAAISMIFIDFRYFHGISWSSMSIAGSGIGDECHRYPAP